MNLTKNQRRNLMDDIELILGEPKIWLTIPEFARICAAHKHTVWQWCAAGEIEARQSKKGAPYFIHFTQAARFMPEEAA